MNRQWERLIHTAGFVVRFPGHSVFFCIDFQRLALKPDILCKTISAVWPLTSSSFFRWVMTSPGIKSCEPSYHSMALALLSEIMQEKMVPDEGQTKESITPQCLSPSFASEGLNIETLTVIMAVERTDFHTWYHNLWSNIIIEPCKWLIKSVQNILCECSAHFVIKVALLS